jgi:ATP-dependent Clp protease ATP-binding subunit ClpB
VSGEVEDGATIRVDATDDELVVTWDDVAGTEDEAAWRR